MRVVCLKEGTKYSTEYVNRLAGGLWRHGWEGPVECFTERPGGLREGVVARPLPEPGWPGWWGKLGLFKPGLWPEEEKILFLDLDTVVVGSIKDILAVDAPFIVLRDFYFPLRTQSAVMGWVAGQRSYIWRNFQLWGTPMPPLLGDGDWIQMNEVRDALRWQDAVPGQIVSWKGHCQGGVPPGARLICFHGKPMPHEVPSVWEEARV